MPTHPEDDNSLLHRMLSLSPGQLKLLSKIFEDGLMVVWKHGACLSTPTGTGTPKTSESLNQASGDNNDENDGEIPLSAQHGTELPMCRDAIKVRATPIRLLFDALGIQQTLPNVHHVNPQGFGQPETFPAACLKRQTNTCIITGLTENSSDIETTALVSHTTASIETPGDAAFWRLLRLFLGSSLTDEIYGIVGGLNSFKTTNGLCFGAAIGSGAFDNGVFYLIPRLHDGFDLHLLNSYDVEFKWRADRRALRSFASFLPQEPDDQIGYSGTYNILDDPREIRSGDCFRLFTSDPENYPLPHPILLCLHTLLWEVITTSGVSETYPVEAYTPSEPSTNDSTSSSTPSELHETFLAAIVRPLEIEYLDFKLNQILAFGPIAGQDTNPEAKNDHGSETLGTPLLEVDQFDAQMAEQGFYDAELYGQSCSNDRT